MAVFILPAVCFGFLCGLLIGFAVPALGLVTALLLAGSILTATCVWFYRLKLLFIAATFLTGTCFGVMSWQNSQQTSQYEKLFDQEVGFRAKIAVEPEQTSGGNQAVYLQPETFTQLIRASLFHHAYVKQGQTALVTGVLERPENFSEFNYIKYLQYRGAYAELKRARIYVIDSRQSWFRETLRAWRSKIVRTAEQRLFDTGSAIVLGVLVGQRDQLPNDLQESYRRTGLIHILVVSGYNLTILASSAGLLAYVFGRRGADIAALAIVWLFVLLVGAESPVVRAGIMASVVIVSRSLGRITGSYLLLLYAVTVMAVLNPLRLFYDVGLQLSVVATFGVVTANRLRILFNRTSALSELNWSSVGAILATAPLIALYFGTVSLIAPVANALVLPTIPVLMLLGALTLTPITGQWFAVVTDFVISLQTRLIGLLAELPFSQLEIAFSWEAVLAYYVCALVIVFVVQNRKNTRLNKTSQSDTMTKIII